MAASSLTEAILQSWTWEPRLLLLLFATAIVYARGWRVLYRLAPTRFPWWRLLAFLGGLTALWAALASPLDAFAGLLLSVHMVQHLLLMAIAPPLLLLGAPAIPLLRGLPRRVARDVLGPFLSWPALQRVASALTHPLVAGLIMALMMWAWHVPALYQIALRSPGWHEVEHAAFFLSSVLFWWPVIQPWPSRPQWPQWAIPLYLLVADLQNTALSALLAFTDRVVYPVYAAAPRPFGGTALEDQVTAGVLLWLLGSLTFLVPAVVLTLRYLASPGLVHVGAAAAPVVALGRRRSSATVARRRPVFDLLEVPLLGPLLRGGAARRVVQGMMLLLAAAIVVDGLFGPQMAPMNLAGVLPWTYWRGFVVVALLVVGNVFCAACPFMLPRDLGRRLGLAHRRWPRALRSKWLAVVLLVAFYWAYETFSLWDSPRATATIIIAYFATAVAVDTFFRGASFCKYVCPIGQFHFASSLVSPLAVTVRDAAVCSSCTTHDCLRGNATQRGCELNLFLPKKAGSMDCTFCLDCVRACPHENVGIRAEPPGAQLWSDRRRSSVGRFSRRPDLAALALVLVFAAFANAAAMVGPVVAWRDQITGRLGLVSTLSLTSVLVLLALTLGFVVWTGLRVLTGRRELSYRFVLGLLPLGLAMWSAHFIFHLLTGWHSGWPVFQRVAGDLGFNAFGESSWSMPAAVVGADALLALELLVLDAGLLLTLYVGWRIACSAAERPLRLLAPWAAVAVVLYFSGVWIFLQPMQMRGMVH